MIEIVSEKLIEYRNCLHIQNKIRNGIIKCPPNIEAWRRWSTKDSIADEDVKISGTYTVFIFVSKANYNDSDGGILFGRWTETYPKNCTPPTAWTGSTAILEKFWKKKFYVKYGQCWVFSGLVTTRK